MPLLSLEEFAHNFTGERGRFLGCDVGEKTIGLALSDAERLIATPLFILRRTQWKKDSLYLLKEIETHKVTGLIVGFPLNMTGTEGPRCQSVRQFCSNFLHLCDLPLCLWDERLSTVAVSRPLLEADLSRAKRKSLIDKVAAAYILQGFLDARRHLIKGRNLTV